MIPRGLRRFLRLSSANRIQLALVSFRIQVQYTFRMMSLRSLNSGAVSDQLFATWMPVSLANVRHRSVDRIPIFRTLRCRGTDVLTHRTLWHRLSQRTVLVTLDPHRIVPLRSRLGLIHQRFLVDVRLLPLALSNARRNVHYVGRRVAMIDHSRQAGSTLALLVAIVHRNLPLVRPFLAVSALGRRGQTTGANVAHRSLPLVVATVVGLLRQNSTVHAAHVRHRSVVPAIRSALSSRQTTGHAHVRH